MAVAPNRSTPVVADAIVDGGGRVVDVAEAEALVWTDAYGASTLRSLLDSAPGIKWVQLPFAGVEDFVSLIDGADGVTWTCAKGAYSEAVAEHALALGLAGLRQLTVRARARSWGAPAGRRLMGQRVTIIGGGGIAQALIRLLAPFRVDVTVVKRTPGVVAGASTVVVGLERIGEVLPGAALVVLALPLTPSTRGVVGATELALMSSDAWLVNVARGAHVVTDDLVAALLARAIGGAALDVTHPEPLPDEHPLWTLDNCLITPHVSNTWEDMAQPQFAERVRENLLRYGRGEPLLGLVDPAAGY